MKAMRISTVGLVFGLTVSVIVTTRRPPEPAVSVTDDRRSLATNTIEASPSVRRSPLTDEQHPLPRSPLRQAIALTVDERLAEPDATLSEDMVCALVDAIPAAHFGEALTMLEETATSDAGCEVYARLVRRWASEDARGAAEWLLKTAPSAMRRDAIEQIALAWSGSDAAEAATWADRLPVRAERECALLAIAYEAARSTPATALAIAEKLEHGVAAEELRLHAVRQWAAAQPVEAAVWALELTDFAVRERLSSAVATVWADNDPECAADFVLRSLPSGRAREDAVIGILQRWLQRDPAAATRWVSQFAAGPLRQTAIAILASQPAEASPAPHF